MMSSVGLLCGRWLCRAGGGVRQSSTAGEWRARTRRVERPAPTGGGWRPPMGSSFDRTAVRGSLGPTAARRAVSAPVERVGRAMRVYIERIAAHERQMTAEASEFERGKRHLAVMMGLSAATMTQHDVDTAVNYLFPSGLREKRARPVMKPPEEFYPVSKKQQIDESGRPFHTFFYTRHANFVELMHDINNRLESCQAFEDKRVAQEIYQPPETLSLAGTRWISQDMLSDTIVDNVTDDLYAQFVAAMEHLAAQPYAYVQRSFVLALRMATGGRSGLDGDPALARVVRVDEATGRRVAEATGKRKSNRAFVQLWDGGSGEATLNGLPISRWLHPAARESVLAPFVLLDRLGQFDLVAESHQLKNERYRLNRAGHMAPAGAVRLAAARALFAFISDEEREKLRLAGLLTQDPRVKERHKINQIRARKMPKWRRR